MYLHWQPLSDKVPSKTFGIFWKPYISGIIWKWGVLYTIAKRFFCFTTLPYLWQKPVVKLRIACIMRWWDDGIRKEMYQIWAQQSNQQWYWFQLSSRMPYWFGWIVVFLPFNLYAFWIVEPRFGTFPSWPYHLLKVIFQL